MLYNAVEIQRIKESPQGRVYTGPVKKFLINDDLHVYLLSRSGQNNFKMMSYFEGVDLKKGEYRSKIKNYADAKLEEFKVTDGEGLLEAFNKMNIYYTANDKRNILNEKVLAEVFNKDGDALDGHYLKAVKELEKKGLGLWNGDDNKYMSFINKTWNNLVYGYFNGSKAFKMEDGESLLMYFKNNRGEKTVTLEDCRKIYDTLGSYFNEENYKGFKKDYYVVDKMVLEDLNDEYRKKNEKVSIEYYPYKAADDKELWMEAGVPFKNKAEMKDIMTGLETYHIYKENKRNDYMFLMTLEYKGDKKALVLYPDEVRWLENLKRINSSDSFLYNHDDMIKNKDICVNKNINYFSEWGERLYEKKNREGLREILEGWGVKTGKDEIEPMSMQKPEKFLEDGTNSLLNVWKGVEETRLYKYAVDCCLVGNDLLEGKNSGTFALVREKDGKEGKTEECFYFKDDFNKVSAENFLRQYDKHIAQKKEKKQENKEEEVKTEKRKSKKR